MDGDQQHAGQLLGEHLPGRMPRCRQQMVRFIYDYPVWSASLQAELLETREERGEKSRPIFEGESEQIDHRVLRGLGEKLQDFRNAGRPLRIAQHDSCRDILVVPFRVNNTKLVPVLSQAL